MFHSKSLSGSKAKAVLAAFKSYVKLLDFTHMKNPDSTRYFFTHLPQQYLAILQSFKQHLPQHKKEFWVLSDACGDPIEYISLRVLYDQIFGENGYIMHYRGIDVEDENNQRMRLLFKKFPHFKILTADGSDAGKIRAALEADGGIPEHGFDITLLRQPEILGPVRAPLFQKMLDDVLPRVSTKDGTTIISCYFKSEIETVFKILSSSSFYSKVSSNYFICEEPISLLKQLVYTDGQKIDIPDMFALVFKCNGLAFKKGAKTTDERTEMKSAKGAAALRLGILKSADTLAREQSASEITPLLLSDEYVGPMGPGRTKSSALR